VVGDIVGFAIAVGVVPELADQAYEVPPVAERVAVEPEQKRDGLAVAEVEGTVPAEMTTLPVAEHPLTSVTETIYVPVVETKPLWAVPGGLAFQPNV